MKQAIEAMVQREFDAAVADNVRLGERKAPTDRQWHAIAHHVAEQVKEVVVTHALTLREKGV